LAQIRDLPDDILLALAQDDNWEVRWRVAHRPQKLPSGVIQTLQRDKDQEVLGAIRVRLQTERHRVRSIYD
jgi:hypothetical protein